MMRKAMPILIVILLILSVACDKLFLDISGKEVTLQGKWQLTSEDTIFFAFQNRLFEYQICKENDLAKSSFGYYTLYGDTAIRLELLREYSFNRTDPFGWDTIPGVDGKDTIRSLFYIDQLSRSKLVLSNERENLVFRKF